MTDDKTTFNETSANSEVNKVSVKLTQFWTTKPRLWFTVVEAQFTTNKITADATKYYHVLQILDQSILSSVEDFVANPPDDNIYEG